VLLGVDDPRPLTRRLLDPIRDGLDVGHPEADRTARRERWSRGPPWPEKSRNPLKKKGK
jgi:hypothetical protein